MRQKTIFIKKILLPKKSLFPHLINELLGRINDLTGRKNTPSALTQQKRLLATKLVIEGLYRCYCSQLKDIALAVPHHPNAYKAGEDNKINEVGYKIILSVIDAMEMLGWVQRKMGRRLSEDSGETTELRPSGKLLEEFKLISVTWQQMEPIKDVVVLRNYGDDHADIDEAGFYIQHNKRKQKYKQKIPDSNVVRKIGVNLRKINRFLTKQCICLLISNVNFQRLGAQMVVGRHKTLYDLKRQAQNPRYLDLTMAQLRRIFSRDSMNLGGRFYGGWWQFIPKEYRVHITINYLPTIEVDYSGLHPYMIYHLDGLTPPEGDMYDIGVWKTEVERERKRPIVKEFFNAIVNDEYGSYRMSKESRRALGINNRKVRELIDQKHPQIAHRFNSGYGLTLQYEDSKIAERVMLLLLKQDIPCLPMHDSFIVQATERSKVAAAMNQAYKERFGIEIDLKSTFLFDSDGSGNRKHAVEFPFPTNEKGEVDQGALFQTHEESIHNQYCYAWLVNRQQKKRSSRQKTKYRFGE